MRVLCGRATRWRTMRSLFAVAKDLNELGFRIEKDFERRLGVIESHGVTVPRVVFKPHSNSDASRDYDNRVATKQANDEKRFNRRISRRSR